MNEEFQHGIFTSRSSKMIAADFYKTVYGVRHRSRQTQGCTNKTNNSDDRTSINQKSLDEYTRMQYSEIKEKQDDEKKQTHE